MIIQLLWPRCQLDSRIYSSQRKLNCTVSYISGFSGKFYNISKNQKFITEKLHTILMQVLCFEVVNVTSKILLLLVPTILDSEPR